MRTIEIKDPLKRWWEGDKRVEEFMPAVSDAIERSGITGAAKVDIYNRSYEAVYKAIKKHEGKSRP